MSHANQTFPTPVKQPGGIASLGAATVSRIGFGAMQLPGPGVWGPPRNRDAALAVLRRAVELGVNHIDTAQYYGDGVANQLIHAALYPYPAGLVLVSKVGAERHGQGEWAPAQRPEQLRAGVEANLGTLEIERLNVVNLRLFDDGLRNQIASDQRVDLDSQLDELARLRDEGKIEGIGLSNATLDQLQRALPAGLVCVQNAYSLVNRSDEPLLDLCRARGIAWVPFFPLGSAFPNLPKVTDQAEVIADAQQLGVTPAQVGLAWLLAHAPEILLIPGTSSVTHLEENVAAGGVHLEPRMVAALDGLGEAAPRSA
jgi:aryl-alcohol dehydrogenase-like predicted oxidoreductase